MLDYNTFIELANKVMNTPRVYGCAVSHQGLRWLHAHTQAFPEKDPQTPAWLLGPTILEDPDLDGYTLMTFYSQEAWDAYLAYRVKKLKTPFWFQAYIDKGLIVQAQVRMLWDKQ